MDEENIFLLINLLHAKGAIGEYNEPIEGITRLTKLLYLLKEETSIANHFSFIPYKMGPFSSEIYRVIEFMKTYPEPTPEGSLIKVTDTNNNNGIDPEAVKFLDEAASDTDDPQDIRYSSSIFELTETGQKIAEKIWSSLSEKDRDDINYIKVRYAGMSLKDLLRYVYGKYPDMTTRSEIKHQL